MRSGRLVVGVVAALLVEVAWPRPCPSVRVARRMAEEIDVVGLVHWGLNTYVDREWGFGDDSPSLLDPKEFSADALVAPCRAAGLRGLIVVAKHHDGFCLWPTKTTDYNIAHSPFWNGRGDYVREMADACRRAGLKVGLYVSPWDRNSALYATPAYLEQYRAQWAELLSGDYGDIFEIWFDGANGGDGYYGGARTSRTIADDYYQFPQLYAMIRRLQPDACIYGGLNESDIRWGGNERGILNDDARATIGVTHDAAEMRTDYKKYFNRLNVGEADGAYFRLCEIDVPLRRGWFYHSSERHQVKSAWYLTKLYLLSVGNGGNFTIGLAPDREGRLAPEDETSLREFGALRKRLFSSEVTTTNGLFNLVELREDLTHGELVDDWSLRVDGRRALGGKSIGYKRIRLLPQPVSLSQVELQVGSRTSLTPKVTMRRFLVDREVVTKLLSVKVSSQETEVLQDWKDAQGLRESRCAGQNRGDLK